ncbi:MAG: hypothetical protein Tsb0020_06170 [Haliangiales bacterium]
MIDMTITAERWLTGAADSIRALVIVALIAIVAVFSIWVIRLYMPISASGRRASAVWARRAVV